MANEDFRSSIFLTPEFPLFQSNFGFFWVTNRVHSFFTFSPNHKGKPNEKSTFFAFANFRQIFHFSIDFPIV